MKAGEILQKGWKVLNVGGIYNFGEDDGCYELFCMWSSGSISIICSFMCPVLEAILSVISLFICAI